MRRKGTFPSLPYSFIVSLGANDFLKSRCYLATINTVVNISLKQNVMRSKCKM